MNIQGPFIADHQIREKEKDMINQKKTINDYNISYKTLANPQEKKEQTHFRDFLSVKIYILGHFVSNSQTMKSNKSHISLNNIWRFP